MPISRKEFLNWSNKTQRILNFLRKNKDRAYLPVEIARALKLKANTVTSTMGKLARKEFLLRKSPYYTYNNLKMRK